MAYILPETPPCEEIEVTEEMYEAGACALSEWGDGDNIYAAGACFRAMAALSPLFRGFPVEPK